MLHPWNELINIISMYFFAKEYLRWASWRTNLELVLTLCDLARIMIPPYFVHNLQLSEFDVSEYFSIAV